jgi:NB-ARC domain
MNSKSRIAIEFLYRTAGEDSDRSIYWVSAASASRFLDSLRDIIREIPKESLDSLKELNTSTQGDSKSLDILQIVKHWLSSPESSPWLIILDNADTSEIFDKTGTQKHPYIWYIPRSKTGRVLMTTRSRGIGERFQDDDSALIHVTAMASSEAVELFHNSLPNDKTPIAQVEELAKTLDFLPLAIKQAIAYIRYFKPMTSIGEYLIKFKTDEERLLQREFSDAARDSDDLTNAVVITWLLNFDQISTLGNATTEVISCLAVLDREAIPTFLLMEMLGEQDLVEDIGFLFQYSFMVEAASPIEAPSEKIWSVHRLVHRTMQIWLRDRQQQEQWKGKALALLGDAFNLAMKSGIWWKARLLLPHVRLALSYPAASDVASSTLRRLISEFERPTWLSMSKERSESERIQATQHAIEGTCDWLFKHALFVDWLYGQSRLLFLLGKPGSGKTTLW